MILVCIYTYEYALRTLESTLRQKCTLGQFQRVFPITFHQAPHQGTAVLQIPFLRQFVTFVCFFSHNRNSFIRAAAFILKGIHMTRSRSRFTVTEFSPLQIRSTGPVTAWAPVSPMKWAPWLRLQGSKWQAKIASFTDPLGHTLFERHIKSNGPVV